MKLDELLTPALLVDLDIMEANLQNMAEFFRNRKCKLRPHFKNHKCVALAKKQLEAGAIGISTATLHETEMLVDAGVSGILIANEITGEANLRRLIKLSEQSEIILAVDNVNVVDDIKRLSGTQQTHLSLVVDVDLGLKRCGVQGLGSATNLARQIVASGVKFDGLMGYEGHLQRLDRTPINQDLRISALNKLAEIKSSLLQQGIPVNIVSAGGTGTYSIAGSFEGITEVQAGNYLFMDTSYAPFAPEFLPSLTLLTTVISVTPGERFVINTGIKEISAERGMPLLRDMPDARLTALHAEHGIVVTPNTNFKSGDLVELNIFYSDGTVNLHDKIYGVRKGIVEEIFSTC